MATLNLDRVQTRQLYGLQLVTGTISMSNSYTTGGEAINLPLTDVKGMFIENRDGYSFQYDAINKKMKVFQHLRSYTVSVDLPSIAAGATSDVAVTVTGITTNDNLVSLVTPGNLTHGLVIQEARITAANTITLRVSNLSAAAIDELAKNYTFVVQKNVAQEVPNGSNLSTLTGVSFLAYGW